MTSPFRRTARRAVSWTVSRAARLFAAAVAAGVGAALLTTAPAQAAPPLEKVSGFTNPGALDMYVHRPADLPDGAPVIVALHGCTQTAQEYADHSGLVELADEQGLLLVFAEQRTANNFNRCFNWFQGADIARGQGEVASIRNMAAHAVSEFGGDAGRVYATGLSAGGAMTTALLAAYPDAFQAGGVMAGLPYKCATSMIDAFTCMNPGKDKSPQEWARLAASGHPSWEGPWPRVAVWHGTSDYTVVERNADELRDQWTAVHGLGQTPDRTSTLEPNGTLREEYLASDGTVAVQVNRVPGMGHGTPVRPGGGPEECGQSGQYFPDTICSSRHLLRFFGLQG
ncbi:PHB depolymerase family esterase [Nocardiopsis sp. RSe5-2]|uniref:PHB depolymerase family esterase n=1 Tax=Nocardiopsis endophytica TaxID=3018445 RepID=A0ABT4U241_9ACTN|nr:PHB depolymerase family esterase [Nocardiopsis endophytica]MDA2810997.1 PHB depolymerase family esterase [Nocardiopsis endophytica]